MTKSLIRGPWALLLGLILPTAGCVAAAAGAGAAGAVYLTSRGAEALVEGSVDNVESRALAVMSEMGIVKDGQSSEDGGDQRELKGKKGDLDVTIAMKRKSPTTTEVEVTARENLAEWDKDFAQDVLNRIVKKG